MEKLKDNLPILSLFLLITCTFNTFIFYNYFGIDILYYLDFTETLQIQFKPFAISVCAFIGLVIFAALIGYVTEWLEDSPMQSKTVEEYAREHERLEYFESKNVFIPKEEIETGYKKFAVQESMYYQRMADAEREYQNKPKRFKAVRSFLVLSIPFAFSVIILFLAKHLAPNVMRNALLFSIPFFAIAVLFSYISLRKDIRIFTNREKLQGKKDSLKVIGLFVIIAYAGAAYARASAIDLVISESEHEVELTLEDKIITTNKLYRYVGKSKDYIFFYNVVKKQADIFKMDKAKALTIKGGIDYEKQTK